jgi:type IV pilus assembly protein PilP
MNRRPMNLLRDSLLLLMLLALSACGGEPSVPQPNSVSKKIAVQKVRDETRRIPAASKIAVQAPRQVPRGPNAVKASAKKPAPSTSTKEAGLPKPLKEKPPAARTAVAAAKQALSPTPSPTPTKNIKPPQVPVGTEKILAATTAAAAVKQEVSSTPAPTPVMNVKSPQVVAGTDKVASEPSDLVKKSLQIADNYDPTGRFDPFEPLFKAQGDQANTAKHHEKRKPQTPLERIALSQLKLTAVIQAHSGNCALVEDATGKGYVVKKGTYIGLNAGRVTEIDKDRIVVQEEVENVMGALTLHNAELKIQKPAGEL